MRAMLVSRVLQGTKVERHIIFAIGADIFLEAESDSDSEMVFLLLFSTFLWMSLYVFFLYTHLGKR